MIRLLISFIYFVNRCKLEVQPKFIKIQATNNINIQNNELKLLH